MSILSEKIAALSITARERYAQVIEVCSLLNDLQPVAPTKETRYKLKPLLIPHLIEEGILAAEKLQEIKDDSCCRIFLEELVREHYRGVTEITPAIERLLAAGQTFLLLDEAEVRAVRDRLNIEKIREADRSKLPKDRRYEEWIEEIPQPPVSWAQINLGRAADGEEILQLLGELYGSDEENQ